MTSRGLTLARRGSLSIASGWTPASLPGIAAWGRADDLSAQADASAVASWVERIVDGDFAQADVLKQPVFYRTTAARLVDGHPVVSSDGINDLLVMADALGAPTSGHVIIIGKFPSFPLLNQDWNLLASADTAEDTRFLDLRVTDFSGTPRTRTVQRDNATTHNVRTNTGTLALDTPCVIEFSSTGTAFGFRLNGAVLGKTTLGGSDNGNWIGDITGPDNIALFARRSATESGHAAFDMAEFIITGNQTLSAGDRTSLNTYLGRYPSITMT